MHPGVNGFANGVKPRMHRGLPGWRFFAKLAA